MGKVNENVQVKGEDANQPLEESPCQNYVNAGRWIIAT